MTWVWRTLRAFCVCARSVRRAVIVAGRGSSGCVVKDALPLEVVLGTGSVGVAVGDATTCAALSDAVLSASFVSTAYQYSNNLRFLKLYVQASM